MKKRRTNQLILTAAAIIIITASIQADSWTGFLGCNRDGHSSDTALIKQWPEGGPSLIWKSNKEAQAGYSSCIPVTENRVKGTFKVTGSGASWAHPVVTGGRLYLRYDTNLYCFDIK